MTMAQNVARIAAAKEDIRQVIIEKGVDVEQTDLIDTYADKIAQISQDTPNIITFERYTERINTKKKSINGSGWQSIVSTNVFVEDILPIDSRLHNTVLLMTTQFKADKNITFNADNLRVIIDLEWLDSSNNVIKSDLNLETNFKMTRKVDNVDLYDTVSSTLKQGYFYSAMFGLRIHEIPGWSGVPAGATQLKLKALKTELIYSGALYLESGAGTMCSVLSNEGHEDPPTPPTPTPTDISGTYAVYVKSMLGEGPLLNPLTNAGGQVPSEIGLVINTTNGRVVRYLDPYSEEIWEEGDPPPINIQLTGTSDLLVGNMYNYPGELRTNIMGQTTTIRGSGQTMSEIAIDTVNKKIILIP